MAFSVPAENQSTFRVPVGFNGIVQDLWYRIFTTNNHGDSGGFDPYFSPPNFQFKKGPARFGLPKSFSLPAVSSPGVSAITGHDFFGSDTTKLVPSRSLHINWRVNGGEILSFEPVANPPTPTDVTYIYYLRFVVRMMFGPTDL